MNIFILVIAEWRKKNLACFLELTEELGPSKQELHEEEVKIETNDNYYQQKKYALKELVVGKI